ncbi:unnamed protein product [Rodentolepis nana]|uniref:Transcriptional activator protein Pur-alpha n=1 Tax=Rodentolepis nana TaxID=102285 RepID=A0A0R3T3F6_RODNA|nr:unnamed protein product [Rodentolepis nana]
MQSLYFRPTVPIIPFQLPGVLPPHVDLTQEEDLDSVSLQFQQKRFYVDVKKNRRGRFMKIAEVGIDGRKSRILLTMTAADELKEQILDLANAYDEITVKESEQTQQTPDSANTDGVVKSHTLNYPHRRYYLDLKKNNRGYFLRITMISSNARIKLAIPAEGMRKLYSSICSMLKTWWVPVPEQTSTEVSLPPSKAFRIDNRTLYFDPVANKHGVFLRISQVWASSRSAITIPAQSMNKFREIINEFADRISASTIDDKENQPEGEEIPVSVAETEPLESQDNDSSHQGTSI